MKYAKYFALLLCVLFMMRCQNPETVNIKDCLYCHKDPPDPHVPAKIMADTGHAFDCNVCHVGNSLKDSTVHPVMHDNGKGDVVFDTAFFLQVFRQTPEIYYEDGTCYNIPCHGSGRIDWDSTWGEDENGVWFIGRDYVPWYPHARIDDTVACIGCHDHSNHRLGHDCVMCHSAGTIIDSITLDDYSLHINGYDEPYEEPDTQSVLEKISQ
jgi:hypothetical protein